MTVLLLVDNNDHLPLQKWAGDSSRYVLNFVTTEKHRLPKMSYVREQLLK